MRDDVNGIYYELTDGTYTTTSPDTTNINEDKYVKVEGTYPKYIIDYVTETEEVKSDTNLKGVTAWVDEEGKLVFSGLGAGDYTLTETTTPVGYNTIEPIKFTIKYIPAGSELEAGEREGFNVVDSTQQIILGTDEANNLMATIVNKSGALLPSTGGIGTTIFYVLGSILLIGAGVLLVTKKKMADRQ